MSRLRGCVLQCVVFVEQKKSRIHCHCVMFCGPLFTQFWFNSRFTIISLRAQTTEISWKISKLQITSRTLFWILQGKGLIQCFSTGAPRHTSVPWTLFMCAAKSYNVLESMQKQYIFDHFCTVLLFKCAAKHFYYYSVPQVQKGWDTLG